MSTRYAVRRTTWWTEDDETVATWPTKESATAFATESNRCWPSEYYEVVVAPEQNGLEEASSPEYDLRDRIAKMNARLAEIEAKLSALRV